MQKNGNEAMQPLPDPSKSKDTLQVQTSFYELGKRALEMFEVTGERAYLNLANESFEKGYAQDLKCGFGWAICEYFGYGMEKNEERADEFFERYREELVALAEDGDDEAFVLLYECAMHGHGMRINEDVAQKFLQKAIKAENARACYLRARCTEETQPIKLLEKAYLAGFHLAFYDMGALARFGYHLYDEPAFRHQVEQDMAYTYWHEGCERTEDARCQRALKELRLLNKGYDVWEGTLRKYLGAEKHVERLELPPEISSVAPEAFADYTVGTLVLPAAVTELPLFPAGNVAAVESPNPKVNEAFDREKSRQKRRGQMDWLKRQRFYLPIVLVLAVVGLTPFMPFLRYAIPHPSVLAVYAALTLCSLWFIHLWQDNTKRAVGCVGTVFGSGFFFYGDFVPSAVPAALALGLAVTLLVICLERSFELKIGRICKRNYFLSFLGVVCCTFFFLVSGAEGMTWLRIPDVLMQAVYVTFVLICLGISVIDGYEESGFWGALGAAGGTVLFFLGGWIPSHMNAIPLVCIAALTAILIAYYCDQTMVSFVLEKPTFWSLLLFFSGVLFLVLGRISGMYEFHFFVSGWFVTGCYYLFFVGIPLLFGAGAWLYGAYENKKYGISALIPLAIVTWMLLFGGWVEPAGWLWLPGMLGILSLLVPWFAGAE